MSTPEAAGYDLNDLASRAGVSVRTVRYYIQQGLLPKPGQLGPGVRYSEDYLLRLRLIRLLQSRHQPLVEIRKQMDSLRSSAEVEAALKAPHSSAIDYVRSVMGDWSPGVEHAEPARSALSQPAGSALVEPARSALRSAPSVPGLSRPGPRFAPGINLRAGRGERSNWERIPLTDDLELHVRRPLSRHANRRVERLLELARQVFEEEP